MNTDIIKPPIEELLLDKDLHNMIKALAYRACMHYKNYNTNSMINQHDLYNEGVLGATVAYSSYNPSKFTSFKSWAYPYIKNAIRTYCVKFGHPLSISEHAARDSLPEIRNIGIVYIDQPFDNDMEFDIPIGSGTSMTDDLSDSWLRGFSNLEQQLVKDHYIHDLSLQAISYKYKISKSNIKRIIDQLTDRIKERANEE